MFLGLSIEAWLRRPRRAGVSRAECAPSRDTIKRREYKRLWRNNRCAADAMRDHNPRAGNSQGSPETVLENA